MTLEQTTELYASVLRQLLPVGGYDASPNTEALSVDVYAHAKLLAQADLDAKRLLNVLEGIPSELINEYEAEYGLPLKCTVNASRTFEERLQILNWVRTSRNVLNRAYLKQLLAIFDVVLIDIVKFKPLLCTAPCNSPVNTEQLRYKVFLRLQYPMNADMNCIIENYLPGYLRVEWMIDMPWGDWILNSCVTVNTNGIAHYTAYKTNQREYYDSYANLDLTTAIVRSLHDADMQQWQAVSNAIQALSNNTDSYIFDTENEIIRIFFEIASPDLDAVAATLIERYRNSVENFVGINAFHDAMKRVGWVIDEDGKVTKKNEEQNASLYKYYSVISSKNYKYYHSRSLSATEFCSIAMPSIGETSQGVKESTRTCYGATTGKYIYELNKVNPLYQTSVEYSERVEVDNNELQVALKNALESNDAALAIELIATAYSYDAIAGKNDLYNSQFIDKTFKNLADQILQHTKSADMGTAMYAEAYIVAAANSIFNADMSKQFVKLSDLLSQFELNKTLRT